MIKCCYKTGASLGEFSPFIVNADEIVLTAVSLTGIAPTDRIVLNLDIGWDKPVHYDMGELEIMLRHGDAKGPVVYQMTEACFYKARTKLNHVLSGGDEQQIYYLTVRSPEGKARIVGPYSLEGIVYG